MLTVYTAICGGKDSLREFPTYKGVKYTAFMDESEKSDTWGVKKADNSMTDPYLKAKYYKILPHKFIKTAYSLWIDGNISLKIDPRELFKYLDDSDILLFKHDLRDCSYMEAVAVVHYRYDREETVEKQMVRYSNEGFPVNYGLAYNGFILRKHTPTIEKLDEFWWNEIIKNSRRDQLSFMYSCWKLGIKPKIVDVGDVHFENEIYRRIKHNYESKY